MQKPNISIIMPAYNSESFIKESIKSVLNQSFTDFELIVVNDGSTDNTSSIVRELMKADSRIQLVEINNSGIAISRNMGIEESSGNLIAFLNADDLWHKEKIKLQVETINKDPNVGLVSCYSLLIDENNNSLGWKLGSYGEGNVFKKMLERDLVSGGSVALIRRDCISRVGFFNLKVSPREDWDFWIRISKEFDFKVVPEILVGYRRIKSNSSINYFKMIQSGELVLQKALNVEDNTDKIKYKNYSQNNVLSIVGLAIIDSTIGLATMNKDFKSAHQIMHKTGFDITLFSGIKNNLILILLFLNFLLPELFNPFTLRCFLHLFSKVKPGRSFYSIKYH